MKPVLVSCSCLFAMISVLVLAQSSRTPMVSQPNELVVAQQLRPGVPLSLSRMRQGALFGRAGAASTMSGPNFAPAITYDGGAFGTNSVAVADVNGDGKPDLVVANVFSPSTNQTGTVGVLLGRGDGTFQPVTLYGSGGADTTSVAVADVNGDGNLDLVVANNCDSPITCFNGVIGVLLGNGDGTFHTATPYISSGELPSWIAVADVNGDGKPDLLVAETCSGCGSLEGTAGVLLNKGDGTFRNAVTYSSGGTVAKWIAVADVNGDGKPDLLVVNYSGSGSNSPNGTVSVLLGNGDGTFKTPVSYGSGGYGATSVAVADVNGDSKPDLLVTNTCAFQSNCATVGVLLGNGDGTFKKVVNYNSGGYQAQSVAVADVNGDGNLDLVVANNCDSPITCSNGVIGVLLGNGDGTFQTAVAYGSAGYSANPAAVADVNADGRPDVLVANECDNGTDCVNEAGNGTVGVLINTSISFGFVASPSALTIAAPGESASTTIAINTNGNLNAQSLTNWSCSGLPAESSCTFGTVSSNNQISMNITTTAASDLHWPVMGHHQRLFYALLLPGLLCVVSMAGRKRTMCGVRIIVLIVALALAGIWVACGGGSSGGHVGGNGGTPTGSSVVTISASNGTLNPSTTVELIVK
jgi:hypothetical protein